MVCIKLIIWGDGGGSAISGIEYPQSITRCQLDLELAFIIL
ncbi:MAG: hypothetical protein OEZ00_01200 [Dehalococcoidia bacterium]|nr:hypothetical protein [Dehalococcoidia bacterium]